MGDVGVARGGDFGVASEVIAENPKPEVGRDLKTVLAKSAPTEAGVRSKATLPCATPDGGTYAREPEPGAAAPWRVGAPSLLMFSRRDGQRLTM